MKTRTNFKKTMALLLALMMLLSVVACSNSNNDQDDNAQMGSDPVKLSVLDTEFVYEKAPERIVVNSLENLQILVALGLGDKIVGYTNGHFKIADCLQKYQDEMRSLNFLGSNATFETILAEGADFVFGSVWTFSETGVAPLQDCVDNNIDIYAISSGSAKKATLDMFYQDILNLGKIFRIEDKAEAVVADLKGEMDAIAAEAAQLKENPTVLIYDNGDKKAKIAADGALQTRQLEMAGGINIFSDLSGTYPDVSWEEIAERNPQWILINEYEDENWTTSKEEFLKNHPALAEVDAVKNDRFISVKLITMREGMQIAEGARIILEAFKAAE